MARKPSPSAAPPASLKPWRLKRGPSAEEMAEKPTPGLLDNLDVHLESVCGAVEKLGRGSPEKVANDKTQIISVLSLLGRLWRDRRSAN